MRPGITVIIPAYNEEEYIETCLASVVENDYPNDRLEVFVVDGMSSDNTGEVVDGFGKKYPFIRRIDNPERYVPYALNRGIKEAKGDYIIRLDAHSRFPNNYFSKLIAWHERLNVDNVGAVCKTDVLRRDPVSESIRLVLSDKLGVGNSYFRTGTDDVREVDTVPFGCYRKEVFNKYGYFDERLVRNQDIEFNKRIIKQGGKVVLVPDVECTYFAKESYGALAKSSYGNGLWNVLTAKYTGSLSSLSIRHFIPLVFVLSILVPLPFMLLRPWIGLVSAASLVVYSLMLLFRSLVIKTVNTKPLFVLWAFVVLHISYGIGSLIGIFTSVGKRKQRIN